MGYQEITSDTTKDKESNMPLTQYLPEKENEVLQKCRLVLKETPDDCATAAKEWITDNLKPRGRCRHRPLSSYFLKHVFEDTCPRDEGGRHYIRNESWISIMHELGFKIVGWYGKNSYYDVTLADKELKKRYGFPYRGK